MDTDRSKQFMGPRPISFFPPNSRTPFFSRATSELQISNPSTFQLLLLFFTVQSLEELLVSKDLFKDFAIYIALLRLVCS